MTATSWRATLPLARTIKDVLLRTSEAGVELSDLEPVKLSEDTAGRYHTDRRCEAYVSAQVLHWRPLPVEGVEVALTPEVVEGFCGECMSVWDLAQPDWELVHAVEDTLRLQVLQAGLREHLARSETHDPKELVAQAMMVREAARKRTQRLRGGKEDLVDEVYEAAQEAAEATLAAVQAEVQRPEMRAKVRELVHADAVGLGVSDRPVLVVLSWNHTDDDSDLYNAVLAAYQEPTRGPWALLLSCPEDVARWLETRSTWTYVQTVTLEANERSVAETALALYDPMNEGPFETLKDAVHAARYV